MKPFIFCTVAALLVALSSGCCHSRGACGYASAPAGNMYGMAAPTQSASLAPIATGGSNCACSPY
ncbi:MAG: hypothetical protein KDA79_16350 [Planctomycetaceae bacterium]|nr:hypothetical protein [Planctomycetaceae bacterium]